MDGGDMRDRLGLFPAGSGPRLLQSTKEVFRFDGDTKEIYLARILSSQIFFQFPF